MFGKLFAFIGNLIGTGMAFVVFMVLIPILWIGAGLLGGMAEGSKLGASFALAVMTFFMVMFFVGMFKLLKHMDRRLERIKQERKSAKQD